MGGTRVIVVVSVTVVLILIKMTVVIIDTFSVQRLGVYLAHEASTLYSPTLNHPSFVFPGSGMGPGMFLPRNL